LLLEWRKALHIFMRGSVPEPGDARCRDDLPHRRAFIAFAAAGFGVLFVRPAGAETPEPIGLVEDVKGQAFAEKDAVRRELEQQARLFIRELVGTGAVSRLTMRLGRNTTVRLGERARLILDRYVVDAGGEIRLEAGPLLFERMQGSAPMPLRIHSKFGLIAVRGTRFFAGPVNEGFAVFVERGSVEVSAAGRSVVLNDGEGSDIRFPGAVPTQPVRWRERRIRAALATVN
jgi:FecR-like protein